METAGHQFVHGTRNLWRQEQCWIKEGLDDQEYLRRQTFNRSPTKAISNSTMFNSAQNSTEPYIRTCD